LKKIFLLMLLFSFAIFTSIFTRVQVNAAGEGWEYDKYARKEVLGSYIYTKFNSNMELIYYVFGPELITWEGTSRSYWSGYSPYYADSITHVDKLKVVGGTTSFSVGTSGAGVSVSTSSTTASIAYTVEDERSIYVYYSYSAYDSFPIVLDQFCTGTFKFGNSYYVVDSEANQYYYYSDHYWI